MLNQILISNQDVFPDTHYFVYKKKHYPIKFQFFLLSSKYFLNNLEEIEKSEAIKLIDEESENSFELTDESIIYFINFVQHQEIPLNNDNVASLNYLANKYEVTSLIEITEKYINRNQQALILDLLLIHQNDQDFNGEKYEEIISKNIESYINDERLLSLKVPILYRIFEKFNAIKQSITIQSKTIKSDINNFLFRCLDLHKKEASILFTFCEFEDSRKEIMNKLITEYSTTFDFHFINQSFIQFLYEEDNQHIQNEIKQAEIIEKMKEEINQLKSNQENQAQTINDLKQEIEELKKEIKMLQNQEKIITINHKEGNEFDGIIKHLTDKVNGNIHDKKIIKVTSNSILSNYHPKNLLNTEINDQYQSDGSSFAWICFDFKDKLIELSSYTIESCNWSKNTGHLKSWVIEISNNKNNWLEIDKHDNCKDLNGPNLIKTFDVKPNIFSRYIRFRHTCECWDGGTFGFNAIEFYGRLINLNQ